VWSEQIDSDTDDIIGLQDIITHRIVEGLKCELETSSPPKVAVPVTQNSLAYIEYLRGRDQLRRYMFHTVANQNLEIAIKHFRRAVDLDPDFALAHCALGTSYLQRVIKVVGERDDLKTAAVVLDRALALDPQLIDARAYRAFIWRLQGETQRSRDELAELRRDAPNTFEVPYLSAACYRFDGDYESSFRCFEEMLRIDPTAQVPVHYCRARLFWYQGEFENAFRELEAAERLEPNHPIVKFLHAVAVFRSGDPARAVKELRTLFSTYPCDGFRPFLSICLSAVGEQEAALGELNEAAERIGAVDPDVSYWLASAHLIAGRNDEAFKWLEQAISLGNHNLRWFEADPILEPIRDDPRYIELVSPLRDGGSSRPVSVASI
jgi:adenylate cyclase